MLELYEVLYSAAGKDSKELYEILNEIPTHNFASKEKKCLNDLITSFKDHERFLSLDLLKRTYGEYTPVCKSHVDVKHSLNKILASRELVARKESILEAVENSESLDNLQLNCAKVLEQRATTARKLSRPESLKSVYDGSGSDTGGFELGVPDIDSITGGFQPGLTFVIAGFISHGKSTLGNSGTYRNLVKGKNVAIASLEIPKDMVYLTYLCIHSYHTGARPIPYQKIFKNELTDEEYNYLFGEVEDSFKLLPGKLLVLGTEDLPGVFTSQTIVTMFRDIEEEIGPLHAFLLDHINLTPYLDPTKKLSGNDFVFLFARAGREFKNKDGEKVCIGLLAQTNREGFKKAVKREGQYDMLALSEFNEIERSATYCVFIFMDAYMKSINECKTQLLKNRIGAVQEDPSIVSVYPEYSCVGDSFIESGGSSGGNLGDMNEFFSLNESNLFENSDPFGSSLF